MSRSAGTGSPVWFVCGAARKEWPRPSGWNREHDVTLTGRRRRYKPPRSMGLRSTFTSREYRCSCGHVGWSNHIDLERMERP